MTDDLQQRVAQAQQRFQELYGSPAPHVLRAPARLNVLGEHVDYVAYLPTASLPFGSHEHAMLMLWRPRADDQVRGASRTAAYAPFSFALADGPSRQLYHEQNPAQRWEAFLTSQPTPAPDWSNYVKGACFFAQLTAAKPLAHGFDFLLDSTIPPRGGSSSSSALTVLAGAALRLANGVSYQPAQLAQASAQAEWFCGTRGGAMDHTAICLAQPGQAVHLSYAAGTAELVPLAAEQYRWVTFFSHEADKGSHVMLEYNERAAVARLLLPAILADLRTQRTDFAEAWQQGLEQLAEASSAGFQTLAECLNELPPLITLAEFARHYPQPFAEVQRLFPALVEQRRHEPLKLLERAQHHLGEIERVRRAVNLLRQPGEPWRELGALLNAAHVSLRELYEVSTPEVEQLRETVLTESAVLGARLMGGGFGGNVLALVPVESVETLLARVQATFYEPRGRHGWQEGAVMVSTPGAGLAEVL